MAGLPCPSIRPLTLWGRGIGSGTASPKGVRRIVSERRTSEHVTRIRKPCFTGTFMTDVPDPTVVPTSDDLPSLFRELVEARTENVFFSILRASIPVLLGNTRVDLVADVTPPAVQAFFSTSGDPGDTGPPESATASDYLAWLRARGFGTVMALPLSGAGRHCGWLVLARPQGTFSLDELALGNQIAAIVALRLVYEQNRRELATSDDESRNLVQRLHDIEDLRLRATLAAGTAHDISNLFALIKGHAQLAIKDAPTELHPDLQLIVRAAGDGHQLLRRLLAEPTEVPSSAPITLLPAIIRDAIRFTRPYWETHQQIAIRTALAPVPAVRGFSADLRQVLVNLLMNAIDAMPNGGTLTVRTFLAGNSVVTEVIDTGVGIAPERQAVIFRPGASTRPNGSGLGLSVSRTIVERYGGTLTVNSALHQGATFTMVLPAVWSLDPDREVGGTPSQWTTRC